MGRDKHPLLLAHEWDESTDPTGWWMSEKVDGVRAEWDPVKRTFTSRGANHYAVPPWFSEGFPKIKLDGELWGGRGRFNWTSGVCRSLSMDDRWKEIIYVVFDAPNEPGPFEERMKRAKHLISADIRAGWHPHTLCESREHLNTELARVVSLGGEGLMLRKTRSLYVRERSRTLLKVKLWKEDEAVVIGYNPYITEKRVGNFKGWTGSLQCQRRNGARFDCGSGLNDELRKKPPVIGTTIVFAYFEESEEGVPRFPSYVGVSADKVVKARKR